MNNLINWLQEHSKHGLFVIIYAVFYASIFPIFLIFIVEDYWIEKLWAVWAFLLEHLLRLDSLKYMSYQITHAMFIFVFEFVAPAIFIVKLNCEDIVEIMIQNIFPDLKMYVTNLWKLISFSIHKNV